MALELAAEGAREAQGGRGSGSGVHQGGPEILNYFQSPRYALDIFLFWPHENNDN